MTVAAFSMRGSQNSRFGRLIKRASRTNVTVATDRQSSVPASLHAECLGSHNDMSGLPPAIKLLHLPRGLNHNSFA